ncbi:unnamed protein product [Fraxinus pennsylvanica]|uniref:BZIP domain-containing protein n=1 Tax=Fraxinus pennsylvanica TaxID=56036 RepID=A0AAD2EDG2_9LAMI|nr:unnamed protein product [Fraxinus pennsylvanica]
MQCSLTRSMQSVKQDFMLSPSIYSTMIPPETTEMNYFVPENPSSFPANFDFVQSNLPAFELNRFLTNLPNYQTSPPVHEFTPNSSCNSNNSTSDETDDPQFCIIDERKQRRMISNRESARRSRMRKQRHLDELWAQVLRLRTEKNNLIDKLNHVSECHDRVLQENERLKEEASDLRDMLIDLQLGTSYSAFRELGDVPCNSTYFTTESSN